MEFQNEIGIIQRKMAASVAGSSRRLEILHVLDIKAGQQVLDIGCGGGHLLEELAKAVGPNGKAIGLDTSQDQLKQAKLAQEEFEAQGIKKGDATRSEIEAQVAEAEVNIEENFSEESLVQQIEDFLNEERDV